MKESEFIPFERAVRIVTKRPTFMKGVKGFLGALRAGIERQPPSDRTKEEIYAELLASFRHSGCTRFYPTRASSSRVLGPAKKEETAPLRPPVSNFPTGHVENRPSPPF